jgi:hypothetical protein
MGLYCFVKIANFNKNSNLHFALKLNFSRNFRILGHWLGKCRNSDRQAEEADYQTVTEP